MSDDTKASADAQIRRLATDPAPLKALAHPLRIRILDELSIHGASTASELGERLGESSGSTSYHLRQLARFGLVQEVEGRGTGRERWWERPHGALIIDVPEATRASEATRAAASFIAEHIQSNSYELLLEFLRRGMTELPTEWQDASLLSNTTLTATVEELAEISMAFEKFTERYLKPLAGRDPKSGTRVRVQFNAFPIIGSVLRGTPTTQGDEK